MQTSGLLGDGGGFLRAQVTWSPEVRAGPSVPTVGGPHPLPGGAPPGQGPGRSSATKHMGCRGCPRDTPRTTPGRGAIILSHRSGEDRGALGAQRAAPAPPPAAAELRLGAASGMTASPGSSGLPSSLEQVGKEPVQAAPHYRGGQGRPPALRVTWAQQTAPQPPLVLQASPAPATPHVLWGQQAGQSPGRRRRSVRTNREALAVRQGQPGQGSRGAGGDRKTWNISPCPLITLDPRQGISRDRKSTRLNSSH